MTIDALMAHGNSRKEPCNQGIVWQDVINQRIDGNDVLIGLMLESNLKADNQKNMGELSALKYGISITDACVPWEATEQLLLSAHEHLSGQFNLDRELTDMDAGF